MENPIYPTRSARLEFPANQRLVPIRLGTRPEACNALQFLLPGLLLTLFLRFLLAGVLASTADGLQKLDRFQIGATHHFVPIILWKWLSFEAAWAAVGWLPTATFSHFCSHGAFVGASSSPT